MISMFLKTLRDFGFSSVSDFVAYLAVCFVQFVNEEREPKEDERDALSDSFDIQCSAFITF